MEETTAASLETMIAFFFPFFFFLICIVVLWTNWLKLKIYIHIVIIKEIQSVLNRWKILLNLRLLQNRI